MRTTVQWVLIAACLTVLVSCQPNAPTVRVGPRDAEATAPAADPQVISALADMGLKIYWQIDANLDPHETILRLVRLDEKLYCITDQNRLIAIDAMRGVRVWRHQIAESDRQMFDPIHADDMTIPDHVLGIDGLLDPSSRDVARPYDAVMINTQTYLVVIDRTTGRVVRDRHAVDFDFAATSSGSTDGVFFYAGTAAGNVAAVRPAEAITAWEVTLFGSTTAPPVYYSNHVFAYAHCLHGDVFSAIQLIPQRKVLWSQELSPSSPAELTHGAVTAAFHVSDKGAFVPCEDKQIYAFDPFTGAELWETPFMTGGPCRTAIQVGNKTVFQYAHEDRLYAVNLFSGAERWNMPEGQIVMALMDDKAYVLDVNKVLHVVDEMTGEEVGAISLADYDVLLANTTAPAIYAAKRTGELVCIRLTSAEPLTAEMLEATPRPR